MLLARAGSEAALVGANQGGSKHLLELDGALQGGLRSFDDAGAAGSMTCGVEMGKAFYNWIKSSFDRSAMRKSGAVIVVDYNHKELSRWEFLDASITEIGLPGCDAASKDAGFMTVKFHAVSSKIGTSSKGTVVSGAAGMQQKAWLPANFRLVIPGVDCRYVSKIEPITWGAGGVSNIVVTVASSHAQDFAVWKTQPVAKAGSLDLLAPNLQSILLGLGFSALQIVSMEAPPPSAHPNTIARTKITMSCSNLTVTHTPGAA